MIRCECAPGYKDRGSGGGIPDCRPVNPCDAPGGEGLCPGRNSTCVPDGPGAHRCQCRPGFEPEADGVHCRREYFFIQT